MKRVLFLLMKRSTLFLLFFYVTFSFLLMNANDAMVLRGVRLLVLQVTAWTGAVENHFYWMKNEEKDFVGIPLGIEASDPLDHVQHVTKTVRIIRATHPELVT